jgi:hypothetical protein
MRTMKRLSVLAFLAAATAFGLFAQRGPVLIITGKAFDAAIPRDFYLEGNAIPTQKRNAVLIHLPTGARAVFALLDTSGYSQDIQAKYVGMFIIESQMMICNGVISPGSYGFGWQHPAAGEDPGPGKITVYDQTGQALKSCETPRDEHLEQPRPLQVLPGAGGTGRLYYGRYVAPFK